METHIIITIAIWTCAFTACLFAVAGTSAVMIIKAEQPPRRDDTTTWLPFAQARDPLHDLSDKQADFASRQTLTVSKGFGDDLAFEVSDPAHANPISEKAL
jgi:hypothetical protein